MTEPHPQLFISIFAYVLGKESDDPAAAVAKEIELGERASWPAFRTLARIRQRVHPVQLKVTHSSLIARARSLALGDFLECRAPRWISIDDDVEASGDDVDKLLAAEDIDILLAPCILRGKTQLNIVATAGRMRQTAGVRIFPVDYGGFALSAVTRAAAQTLDRGYPDLRFLEDGRLGVGVFAEEIRDCAWWGEDFMCCARARSAGLRVEALCDCTVSHAGVMATVDPAFFNPSPATN